MKKYYSERGYFEISFLLKEHFFDVVHVEGYYLMQLLPSTLNIPILLVEHNIEYLLNYARYLLFLVHQHQMIVFAFGRNIIAPFFGKEDMESSIKSCYAYKEGRKTVRQLSLM